MRWLKQSTTVTIQMGPALDRTDGYTEETGLSPTVELSKAGAAFAARNSATAITHDTNGWYRVELNTTDTGTLGPLIAKFDDSATHLPVWIECLVVSANVWDSLVGATDTLDVQVTGIGANVITATSINADAITAAKVADGTIDAATFAAGAINAAAIADAAIDAATFAAGAITASAIAADAIGASELAADAVTEIAAAVAAGSVASVVGAVGSVTGNVGGNVVGSVGSIATGGIAAASFAAGAINAAAVAADAIGASELAADAVAEIAAAVAAGSVASVTGAVGSVTGAVGSVTGNVGGNVTGSVGSVAAGGITAASFAAGAIDAAAIAANAIGASELAADAALEIADAILSRDIDQVEATAALHSLTTAILNAVSRVKNDAGVLKLYRTDGTTLHMSRTITTDATNEPIDELTVGA